jgi:hypothetical protein
VVDQLALDYAGKPVLFIEYDEATAPNSRFGKFWAAYGAGTATNPLVIADSGHQVMSAGAPYYPTYKNMVNQELLRPPQANVQATWHRTGNKVTFSIQVTNQSGVSLDYSKNKAAVHAVVYEDKKVGVTSRYVRSTVFQNITTSLAPGASATFTLDTPDLTGVDWNKLHFLALVDYQPVSGSAYDLLQAAVALPAVSDHPAD